MSDDFIALATTKRLAPRVILEQTTEAEMSNRAARNHQRLLKQARIGRFKAISDFDWDWPRKIDRELTLNRQSDNASGLRISVAAKPSTHSLQRKRD